MTNAEYPNCAIADASGVAKIAYGLTQDGFSAIEFLDLLRLLDEVVVRGQIILVPSGTAIPLSMLEPLRPLYDAGAIANLDGTVKPVPVPASIQSYLPGDIKPLFSGRRSSLQDARLETGRLLGAELLLNRPALPLLRQRDIYDRYAKPAAEHMICDLMGTYKRAASALQALKRRTEKRYNPTYVLVRVPPLASRAVARASSFSDLLEITLDQREEWAELRKSVDRLNAFLCDTEVPWGRKLLEEKKWMQSSEALFKGCEGSLEMFFANSASHILRQTSKVAKDVAQATGSALSGNLPRALEKLPDAFESIVSFLGEQWEERQPWKLRPLRKGLQSYLLLSDRELWRGAGRILGCDPEHAGAQVRHLLTLFAQKSERAA
jgi:hypothetical protein